MSGWEYNLPHQHKIRSENESETVRKSQRHAPFLRRRRAFSLNSPPNFTETQTRRNNYDRKRVHGNRRPCSIRRLPCGVPEEDLQASQRAGARRYENPRYSQPHVQRHTLDQLTYTPNILESALIDTSSFTRPRTVDTVCDFIKEGVWPHLARSIPLICIALFQPSLLSKSD